MSLNDNFVSCLRGLPSEGRPLRVLHCVISLEVGGLERIVVNLTRIGRRAGDDVSILCLERAGALAAEAAYHGATVTALQKPPGIDRQTISRTAEFLDKQQPDVVHTHQIGALWYVGQAAPRIAAPVLLHTEHINNVAKARGIFKRWKCRLMWHRAARFAERFCCVSNDVARSAARWGTVPRSKIHIVLNGVDTESTTEPRSAAGLRAELAIPAGARIIGNVGRLNEVKRQDMLLRGFARLRSQRPGLHLLLVGDGPEMPHLRQLTAALRMENAVTFAGYQAHPERFMQLMDIFALTSRLEGLPLVLLEAWASGLPVVATSVGGIPDLVQHGVNGLLIPEGNEEALSMAVGELLDDPAKASSMAQQGRKLVHEQYSLLRMARNYRNHYSELLVRKQGGSPCASLQ